MSATPSAQYPPDDPRQHRRRPRHARAPDRRDRRGRRDRRRRRRWSRSTAATALRDIVVDASGKEHWERDRRGDRGGRGRRADRHDRPHLPAARRRQDRTAEQAPAEDARGPLDGLHARRCAGLPGDRRRRGSGVPVHDQAQHRRGRLRRHGGARARRHRPAGGDAGDGGQVLPVQGVRRGRRVSDLPRHERPRRDRADASS